MSHLNMTVDDLIKELSALQPALRAKEVIIIAPNGEETFPSIKQQLVDKYNIFGGVENVKNMVLTWQ